MRFFKVFLVIGFLLLVGIVLFIVFWGHKGDGTEKPISVPSPSFSPAPTIGTCEDVFGEEFCKAKKECEINPKVCK